MSELISQADKIKEISKKLEEGIENLFESDKYISYLKTLAKFPSYSFNNNLLIAMQKPDASLVCGFRAWQKDFQRSVKKGEKSIKILAPVPYKVDVEKKVVDADGKPLYDEHGKAITETTEVQYMGFRVVSVFDVSQTEGKELPTLAHKLDGSVENYNDFIGAIEKVSPVPIEFGAIEGSANGYYHLVDKTIKVDSAMSEQMKCKTAIHETAHAMLHDVDLSDPNAVQIDRHTKEVEAESVAFVVCNYYGLDTSEYSFGYIAGWSSDKTLPELKASMERIQSTASNIIKGIDEKLGIDTINRKEQHDKKPVKHHTSRR